MAEKSIGIVIGVSGDKQSASAIEQVAQRGATAFDKLQTALGRAGTGAELYEGKIKKLNRGVNDAAGAIQLISPLVGGLDGNFGKLATGLGNVADLFGTFSNILLKNPIGLAAIALTAGATAFAAFGSGAVAATKDVAQLEKAVADLKAQIDDTNTRRINVTGGAQGVLQRDAADLTGRRREIEAQILAQEALIARQSAAVDINAPTSLGGRLTPGAGQPTRLNAKLADLRAQLKATNDQLDALAEARRRLAQAEAENVNEFEGRGEALASIGVERKRKAEQDAADAALRSAAAQAQLRSAYTALSSSLDPALRAQREMEQSTTTLEQAQRAGIISTEELARMKDLLAQKSYEASEAGQAEARAIADGAAAAERAITPLERYEQQLDNIQRALNANKISEEQAERARGKVKDELDKASGDTTAAAKNARELGLAFSSAFEDAIVGGKTFRDVVKGLGQDLLRVFIRRQLTEPLLEFFNVASKGGSGGSSSGGGGGIFGSLGNIFGGSSGGSGGGLFDGIGSFFGSIGSFFGFANGGLMTPAGPLPLQRYAGGGVANRPQLAMFGEGRTPEAYVPLPDGRSIPVTMQGGGSASPTIIIDARGAQHGVETTIRRVVMGELLDHITDASVRDVERRANRGGSFSKTVGRRRGR